MPYAYPAPECITPPSFQEDTLSDNGEMDEEEETEGADGTAGVDEGSGCTYELPSLPPIPDAECAVVNIAALVHFLGQLGCKECHSAWRFSVQHHRDGAITITATCGTCARKVVYESRTGADPRIAPIAVTLLGKGYKAYSTIFHKMGIGVLSESAYTTLKKKLGAEIQDATDHLLENNLKLVEVNVTVTVTVALSLSSTLALTQTVTLGRKHRPWD